jgi:hypothetical protein
MQSKFTRKVEGEALKYAQSLKPNLTAEEAKAMFEELEEQHAIIEAKLIILGTVYRSLLDEAFQKEEREITLPAGFR